MCMCVSVFECLCVYVFQCVCASVSVCVWSWSEFQCALAFRLHYVRSPGKQSLSALAITHTPTHTYAHTHVHTYA